MNEIPSTLSTLFHHTDKRKLLLILVVLVMALAVLAAGAPCTNPPG